MTEEKRSLELRAVQELTPEEQTKIEEIRRSIDLRDPNAVHQFGSAVQSQLSEFSDKVLDEVRGKDTGHIGDMLSGLMGKVRELDVDSLSGGSFLSRLPFVGSWLDKARGFMDRYQTLSVQIMKIVGELERAKGGLLKDVGLMDGLFERDVQYLQEINLYILAGETRLGELIDSELPALKAESESSADPVKAQDYRDMAQLAGRLEKKLHDLRLSRAIALQAAPQIRLVQNNNRELAEKIQSSILNTIPLWKNQMVVALSLLRQRQALDLQRQVSTTTKELLEKNAEMLKDASIAAAEEAERGIVDIETLKKVNADLISTLEETIRIHREGKARRAAAADELVKIEDSLREKLIDIKQKARELSQGGA